MGTRLPFFLKDGSLLQIPASSDLCNGMTPEQTLLMYNACLIANRREDQERLRLIKCESFYFGLRTVK